VVTIARRQAIIIGAGPAGLTAAYELLKRTDIVPVILEMTGDIGGLSKTVDYKGNRIDIGGHRFFSKSDTIMEWWQNILPIQGAPARDDRLLGRNVAVSRRPGAPDPEATDRVMLVRNRISRIFFMRKFFSYPIALSMETVANLGLARVLKIGASYARARLLPIRQERSLEDFFINRFGKELYKIFFRDYTEKVWGVPCREIKPEWGVQRIKELSIGKTIAHSLRKRFLNDVSVSQKKTETSLIDRFIYPKLGPGQLWEEVAAIIEQGGGRIYRHHRVDTVTWSGTAVTGVSAVDTLTGERVTFDADCFFSTMPLKELIEAFDAPAPKSVRAVASGLKYRDFITVGLLLTRLAVRNETRIKTVNNIIPDNWIYIQERDVEVGRVQIFNNWSPYLVKDENTVWIGLEYFCNEGDALWSKTDDELVRLAVDELSHIGIIDSADVLDSTVIKVPKTYPAYFGTYEQLHIVREFTDTLANLFLIGRNGMHKYNNTDHSMLTAIVSVDNIVNDIAIKGNIWAVNPEEEYHETK
jgi:protoporphyrinogen oxidase